MMDGNPTRIGPVASVGDTPRAVTVTRGDGKRRRQPKQEPENWAADKDEEAEHQLDELG